MEFSTHLVQELHERSGNFHLLDHLFEEVIGDDLFIGETVFDSDRATPTKQQVSTGRPGISLELFQKEGSLQEIDTEERINNLNQSAFAS